MESKARKPDNPFSSAPVMILSTQPFRQQKKTKEKSREEKKDRKKENKNKVGKESLKLSLVNNL